MQIIEINTTKVKWPITPRVQLAMHQKIRQVARAEGYCYFMTKSFRCLNGVENPDLIPPAPEGWTLIDFFSDCENQVNDEFGVFQDLILYARKC